ncbi:hypothetical protein C8R47DRAFT_1230363 [Mycena vitilis]|nr:hypothetical protein C8R47DRAFT_1230363 [Mycena vitilis]
MQCTECDSATACAWTGQQAAGMDIRMLYVLRALLHCQIACGWVGSHWILADLVPTAFLPNAPSASLQP